MCDEVGAQQEIPWGITAEKKFGRDDKIGAGFAGLAIGIEQPRTVGVKIANSGVELEEADLHRPASLKRFGWQGQWERSAAEQRG